MWPFGKKEGDALSEEMKTNNPLQVSEEERTDQAAAVAGKPICEPPLSETDSAASAETNIPAERAQGGVDAAADECGSGSAVEEASGQGAPEPPVSTSEEAKFTLLKHPVARLPNCKITGMDYSHPLAAALASAFKPHEIVRVALDRAAQGVNWMFDEKTQIISCKPTEAGDFEVELSVDVRKYERHVFPLRLTVNPDPKTLWKNLPSDQNGIYAKPDSSRAFLSCGEKCIVAASQRGRSHGQDAKPRDDDYAFHYDTDLECAVMAVADGAGSAKFSRKGSQIAVHTACDLTVPAVDKDFWGSMEPQIRKWKTDNDPTAGNAIKASLYKVLIHAAFEAKKKIAQEAKEHEARYQADYKKAEKFTAKDYATTLILTVAKKFEFGWFVATYWVGDGGVGVYQPELNRISVHGIPDSGEYGGQTCFLTADDAWKGDAAALIQRRIRFDVVDSFKAIILMSDGVSDPKFETENNLNSVVYWDKLWADLSQTVPWDKRNESVSDALLAWMDFWSPGNHDDRTMMVLY